MAEEERTPVQIADERLKDLEVKSQGQLEGLADKISGSFWNRIKAFFMMLFALQWEGGGSALHQTAISIKETFIKDNAPLTEEDVVKRVKEIHRKDFVPTTALGELQTLAGKVPFASYLYRLMYLVLTATGLIKADLSAAWEEATQVVMAGERPSLLPIDATIETYFKDPTLRKEVKDILDRMGISDKFQNMLWIATERPLDEMTVREAYLRKVIDETEHDQILKSHHIADVDIATIKQIYELIPPVNDIITMAVREAFTPEIVTRFGQMEDLPPDFVKWAKQKGLSEYWAKAYWASHWALPSILQGFEMIHRRVIGQPDLNLLLRALDVMPFWRDKLTAISYNPLTRVDVRRMYGLGVLKEEGVFNAYLDVGYNETNAKLMTEFTIAFVSEKEKDLTKADILALYKKSAVARETALSMLIRLGYYEDNAELLMTRADLEIYATFKKEQIGYIKSAYVAGKINDGEALNRLGKLDMPSKEVNTLMESWDLARISKVKELSLDNLKAFFKAKVITIQELTDELRELGYNTQDTNRFILLFQKG